MKNKPAEAYKKGMIPDIYKGIDKPKGLVRQALHRLSLRKQPVLSRCRLIKAMSHEKLVFRDLCIISY